MLNRCSTEWAPWQMYPSGSQMGAQRRIASIVAGDARGDGTAMKAGLEAERLQ